MEYFFHKNFARIGFALAILTLSKICFAQEILKKNYADGNQLPKCSRDLTFKKMPNSISYIDEDIFTQAEGTETCSIGLKFSKKLDYGYIKFTVYSYTKKFDANDVFSYSGFEKNRENKWKFLGKSILLQPKKFTFLKITKIEETENLILIGQAIERGYISKGGPITLKTYGIVRESPEFYIVVEIVIDQVLSNFTTKYLINDLVDVVKNIELRK